MSNREMNAYDKRKWGVYISGSDNTLPAHSFEEAAAKSAEFNAFVVKHIKPKRADDYYLIVFAQVALWDDISKSEHDPENTVWTDAFS
jgi:hypothetical protein